MRPLVHILVAALLFGGLLGCRSYTEQSTAMAAAWQAGNSASAASEAARQAEAATGGRDELLWRLEQGTIQFADADFEGALVAFDRADELVEFHERQASMRLGGRTAALLTNQAVLPYEGRAYDKVMLSTWKALDYLVLGEQDKARVELNRALQRQRDAVADNAKRLEEATAAADASRTGNLTDADGQPVGRYDVDRTARDPQFAAATAAALAQVDARLLPYADYVNPFAVFLDGLFFSHLGADAADLERARKSFERVAGMSPGSYIAEDLAMADAAARGEAPPPLTYVVFATGSAPHREEWRIDIPLFIVSSTSYVGAAFPLLVYNDDYLPVLTVISPDGAAWDSELLCSMDAVVSRDFRNEWPRVLVNTLLTTAAKAIAGKALEDNVGNDEAVKFLAQVVNIGFQMATNRADTRTWRTLPKEFSYVRLPTPESGRLKLTAGRHNRDVDVTPGRTNVIMVRSVNYTADPIITQFTLN